MRRKQCDQPRNGAPLQIRHDEEDRQPHGPEGSAQNQYQLLGLLHRRDFALPLGGNDLLEHVDAGGHVLGIAPGFGLDLLLITLDGQLGVVQLLLDLEKTVRRVRGQGRPG